MNLVFWCTLFFILAQCTNGSPLIFSTTPGVPEGIECGPYGETSTRKRIDLQGKWNVSFDGGATFKSIHVPASIDYEGEAIFQRTVTIDSSTLATSSLKLIAYGINNECEIFLNGIAVGKHETGFTVFEVPIPDGVLRGGQNNELQIIVRNTLNTQKTLPLRKQILDWKNYNGIIRDIFFLTYPRTSIDSVLIRTSVNTQLLQGIVDIQVSIRDTRLEVDKRLLNKVLVADLVEASSDIPISTTKVSMLEGIFTASGVHISLPVNTPRLWSPENPVLYRLRLALYKTAGKQNILIDECLYDIGFVTIEAKNGVLKVNGNPFFVKGIVWHEDAPEFGASLSYERMEKDIAMIKALGANTIRCAFNPPHPYILNLCNRYGVFVCLELPVREATAHELKQEAIRVKLSSMVDKVLYYAGVSPSILAWGIGSSFDSADPDSREYVQAMGRRIGALDSRPVYYGTALLQNDVCANEVPCVGIIPRAGDSKVFNEQILNWKKRYPHVVTFVLNYGKEVLHGNKSGYNNPLSEQAHARFFIQHYTTIKESGISGGFIDAFADWRGNIPILTMNIQDPTIYPRGILSYHREKRLSYDVVRALYSNARIDPFPAGKYRSAYPFLYIGIGFILIFFWGYLFTYNHHFSEAVRRSLFRSFNFFEDIRERRGAHIFYTVLMGVFNAAAMALIFSSLLYYFRTNGVFDYMISVIFPDQLVKNLVIYIAWNEGKGLLLLLAILVCVLLCTLIVWKIIAVSMGKQFNWYYTFASIVWGTTPIASLIPISMVLFKVLQNPLYAIPIGFFMWLILLWCVLRVFRAISITYEVPYPTVIGAGMIIFCCILGVLYLYYENTIGITSYLYYLYHLLQNVV
ncbi:MAG: hypothetical protein N3A63_02830 [Bacteroidetes bacterium]|nr:hypothetical protein [Bacteroidota bacterium]